MTKMCTYFKTETDVAQNQIDDLFSNFDCQRTLPEKGFKWKKYRGTGLILKKAEVLWAELNKKVEASTSSIP